MTKKLALLSGKGGSGKTSLSLCIANLLSSCGIKTLLVDCDLSTNGATYFFEDYLNENGNYHSILNLIKSDYQRKNRNNEYCSPTYYENHHTAQENIASIKNNFDFIPSVSKIDNSISDTIPDHLFSYSILDDVINTYDVVIFDCQAGYSSILENLLPHVDETLFVMEADAISSSSIRSLHLKIGKFLTRKSYQVFNKVTTEEYQIYNKISGGTLFANIESVLFDWSIRKAFALSQIPTVEDVSYSFYEQILNICKVLFGETNFSEKIEDFSKTLTIKKITDERKELLHKLSVKKAFAKNNRIKLFMLLSIVYGMAAFIFVYSILLRPHFLDDSANFPLIVITIVSISTSLYATFFAGKVNDRGESISEIQRKLDELDAKAEKYKN